MRRLRVKSGGQLLGGKRKEETRERKRDGREEVGTQEGEGGERDQEGRKEDEEKEAEEGGCEQVKKDAMDWTVVTRSKKQKQRRVQIFVKVNGSKATPMEVSLTDDQVEDVMRQIQKDEDAYVTMQGKMLKTSEKVKSCGVTDGCTIQFRAGCEVEENTKTRRVKVRRSRSRNWTTGCARWRASK